MPKRKRRAPDAAYWVDWTAELAADLFGPLLCLAGEATPPARIRVHPGKRHVTAVAIYRSADGNKQRYTTRRARPEVGAN